MYAETLRDFKRRTGARIEIRFDKARGFIVWARKPGITVVKREGDDLERVIREVMAEAEMSTTAGEEYDG